MCGHKMIFAHGARIYDVLRELWERPAVSRRIAVALVVLFVCSALGILLKHLGILPQSLAARTPDSPFRAIQFAFTLVLALEVIELIFAVADSVSRAVGKQLEIMGLLLLRDAFKDIGMLDVPIHLANDNALLLHIVVSVTAALLLFICLGCYEKIQRLRGYIRNPSDMRQYINVKKCISLLLFVFFTVTACYDLYTVLVRQEPATFFHSFYSALIFTDILLVLAGQYFMPSFHATFRNSGYAVGTLILRLALGAPQWLTAALCLFAAVYILALTWATSRFLPPAADQETAPPEPAKVTEASIAEGSGKT